MQTAFHKTNPQKRRGGFTMVEMLIVLVIMLTLVTLSTGPILTALRNSAVKNAAASITAANSEAQILARRDSSGSLFYGVELVDSPNGAYVTVVTTNGDPGNAVELLDRNGIPIKRSEIPDGVIVWEDTQPLRAGSGRLVWWFGAGVGNCVSDPRFPHLIAGVGLPRPAGDKNQPAFGLAHNTIDADANPVYLAQGDINQPGLWLSDSDENFQVAVGVYPSGVPFSQTLDREATNQ